MSIITNLELVAFLKRAKSEKWGYVYSGQGHVYTAELAQAWAKAQRAGKPAAYFLEDCKRWLDHVVVDCSGLIVEAFRSKLPTYYDRTANTFRSQAVEHGSTAEMPEIPGLLVWRSGHIGVYIGSGKVIEAAGTKWGVIETPLSAPAGGKPWKEWGQLRDVDYETAPVQTEPAQGAFYLGRLLKLKATWIRGDDVREVQEALLERRYSVGGTGADGVFGPKTEKAVRDFQKAKGLVIDGKVGENTTNALGGVWVKR